MKKNDSLDIWEAIGTVGCWICGISFLILMIGTTCYKAGLELPVMDGFWEVMLNSVLPAAITGLVTVTVSYFVFLKKMPERIAEKLDKKIDPSNLSLQGEQHQIQQSLNPSNLVLHEDHETLRGYLEDAAKRYAVNEDRYRRLDTDGRSIVDTVRKLDGFADMLQRLQERVMELETENRELQRQLEISRERRYDVGDDMGEE